MVRELKEDTKSVFQKSNKENRDFENGIKSISKKLDDLIPELAKVMTLVQYDNSNLNTCLMSAYANCRELSYFIGLGMCE